MVINSIENSKIKMIKKLGIKKYRKEEHKFIVEGIHLVEEAYKTDYLLELIKVEGENFSLDVPTTEITKELMNKISMLDTPSTVIGICKMKEENIQLGNKILILDNIQDPGNVGTIIRTAVAFNVNTLVISNNTVDIYNDKVIRASQGMLFNINIIEKELLEFIFLLKKNNYTIYCTDVKNGTLLKDIKKEDKCVIIMGNEGNGVNPLIKKICNHNIYINMNPKCESLNVGVATGIILYEFDK